MREISTYENKSITEKKNERKRQNASITSIRERDRMVCIASTNENKLITKSEKEKERVNVSITSTYENKIEYKGGREKEGGREGEWERERDDKKLKIFDLKS